MAVIIKKRNPIIGETLPILITAEKTDGTRVDLDGAIIWLTLKTDPTSQADNVAALQIETVHEPTQFDIASPSTLGKFVVTLSATQTAALTADTIYYIDVKIKDSLGAMYYVVPKQTIEFEQWVTRATTET